MKAQTPPFFCASAMTCRRQRRLARGFRPVNLDHAAARQAADAERDVEAQRAGRNRLDLDRLLVLAKPHDRALAEGAFDLRQRGVERLGLVHGCSFHDAEIRLAHGSAPSLTVRAWEATATRPRRPPRDALCAWFVLMRKFFFCPDYALDITRAKCQSKSRQAGALCECKIGQIRNLLHDEEDERGCREGGRASSHVAPVLFPRSLFHRLNAVANDSASASLMRGGVPKRLKCVMGQICWRRVLARGAVRQSQRSTMSRR